ncbi:uncharacterized protein LOC113383674 [Ctenocephalides felis]|uniref:uncharacterized protein LOC113383674 n=1 Tax=Ctenocephalides felis TaxID=7515 RepID=UPI000E6E353E|nr:uncharacterized protein LOC113383674 [Ctenocephalides felis]
MLPRRASLITRKDIWYIKKRVLPPHMTYRNPNDQVSVRLWVREKQLEKKFQVLFYKEVGIADYGLNKDDIILVIMTDLQAKMLMEFGADKLCVDGTHGTNGYGYHLHTLVVVDEFGSGIPVAFCFSNRQDEVILKIFFQEIYKSVGLIKTTTFMTDDAPAYFNAWSHVMGIPENKLLCSWHVSRSWKRATALKIRNRQKERAVYNKLLKIKMILDEKDFHFKLDAFLIELEHKESDFEEKMLEANGYSYKHSVKMEEQAFHQRLRRLNGSLISTRQKDSNVCHTESAKLLPEQIKNTRLNREWEVLSSNDSLPPYVVKQTNETCNTTCMRCETCMICFHTYSCTCIDYVVRSIICQHIHACVRVFPIDTGYRRAVLEAVMHEKSEQLRDLEESHNEIDKEPEDQICTMLKLTGEIENAIKNGQVVDSALCIKNLTTILNQMSSFKESNGVRTYKKMECQRMNANNKKA